MSDDQQKPRATGLKREAVAGDPHMQIASKLKALYTAVEDEPVPDIFLDLLEKLDQVEKHKNRKPDKKRTKKRAEARFLLCDARYQQEAV